VPLNALLRPFVELCLLRTGPQDLPASPVLLGIALAAHALGGTLATAFSLDLLSAIAAGTAGTALLALLTSTLLAAVGHGERTVQTLSALAGADALITFLTLPVLLYAYGTAGQPSPLAGLLVLASIVWSISVFGHILRQALASTMTVGVVVAIVFAVVGYALFNQLFVPGA